MVAGLSASASRSFVRDVIRLEMFVYVLSSVELPLESALVEAARTSNESSPNGALICL